MVAQVEHEQQNQEAKGPFYTLFVDDVEYRFDATPITGAQIMEKAGISQTAGLILLLEDGTQQVVGANEEIELKPGRRFKKAPRFKRG